MISRFLLPRFSQDSDVSKVIVGFVELKSIKDKVLNLHSEGIICVAGSHCILSLGSCSWETYSNTKASGGKL